MPSKYPYKSRSSTEETVRRFFAQTSEDAISLEDAFRAWGRDVTKVDENKQWLSNKLISLKYHNLIVPVYASRNNRRVLDKLQLTLDGKRVLGRVGENVTITAGIQPPSNGNGKKVDFKEVMDMVAELQRQNQDFEITFTAKLKEAKNE